MRSALDALGIGPDALLGEGGEACVYALDADRVARVHRAGARAEGVAGRAALLEEIDHSAHKVPFALPRVLEQQELGGHLVTIEPRLPGRSMMEVLPELSGSARETLVRAYMDAADRIGELTVERPWFGNVLEAPGDTIRAESFRKYLEQRLARNLKIAPPAFSGLDPVALSAALPEAEARALVHLDFFPGNALADGEHITAVIDFGTLSIIGDRRFDPLLAAAYLDPPISPTASDADRAIARAWLREHELDVWYEPALRWITAFWSAVQEDSRLVEWSRSVLLRDQ